MLAEALLSAWLGAIPEARSSSARDLEVTVTVDQCLALEARELTRLTALELDARAVPAESAGGRTTHIEVSCAGNHVRLRVVDPITGKTLERTLALTTAELDVAGRAVALAAAELVLTSWMELTLPDSRAGAVAEPVPADTQRAAEQRARSRASPAAGLEHLLAVAEAWGPFRGLRLGFGAGVRASLQSPWPALNADWDLLVSRSQASTELGEVVASTWSTALRATFKLRRAASFFDAGVGGRFGAARLRGTPREALDARGYVVAGTWGGPLAYTGVGARFGHLALVSGLEAGYVLRSVSGSVSGGDSVGVGGLWLAASVGVGWAP